MPGSGTFFWIVKPWCCASNLPRAWFLSCWPPLLPRAIRSLRPRSALISPEEILIVLLYRLSNLRCTRLTCLQISLLARKTAKIPIYWSAKKINSYLNRKERKKETIRMRTQHIKFILVKHPQPTVVSSHICYIKLFIYIKSWSYIFRRVTCPEKCSINGLVVGSKPRREQGQQIRLPRR